MSPQPLARAPALKCDDAASVLSAIEKSWSRHRYGRADGDPDVYAYLQRRLAQDGCVVDTLDGLEVLEHCRRGGLPIVDVLYAIEAGVREAGYGGGRLALADFRLEGRLVYVFYDSDRFASFAALKDFVAVRRGAAPA